MIKSIIAGILGVFGILCFLYGIMIQATRSGTKFFLVWFGMALVFVMMGIGIYCGIWDKIPMVVRGGILLIFALGMTSFIIVEGCIISSLATEEKENLVFILWGSYAQKKGAFIDRNKHLVLTSAHPSPLSAYNGFFGNKHFSRTNDYLKTHGKTEIAW